MKLPAVQLVLLGGLICLCFVHSSIAFAETYAPERTEQRGATNDAAVLIVADHPDTTMMKVADDLSVAMRDERSGFRVVPVAGDGAEGNVRDVILLRNMDVAITDLTTLERMRRSKDLSQNLALELAHLVTLFPDKLQILANTGVKSIRDLAGRRVAVGQRESGTAGHAAAIFGALGIGVLPVALPPADAAEALLRGDVDAIVCFCLNAPGIYQRLMFNVDLHLLAIPFEGALQSDYLPAELGHEDFPAFIGKGENVETVAVTLALVTYNWPKSNPRYGRVEAFTKRFFASLPQLQSAPRHRGWRSVQAAATLPGWPRFPAAAEWRPEPKPVASEEMLYAFNQFLNRWTSETANVETPDQQKLFEEFLEWRRSDR
ncbi:TAXI family TRAP transporter solute-binding subunit [Rhodomicrobium sp. R_RK_3]|uniref:TAXI family TRAP transporter solute-binding subunit n=1 Tax=Rhodomicrobium sp. R_RK_3 TaxID=2029567 RepID=UPI001482DDC3|nr:TAXI family TRAP transporter solute-binding subunit [Rhodomicrobium sp. R_RK_3]